MNVAESMDLKNTRDNTERTVEILTSMSEKLDKQIIALEKIVRILESRADDGR
mgnify:FL=1